MTQSAVRSDVHQSLDVHLRFRAQRAFGFILCLEDRSDLIDLFIRQRADLFAFIDSGFGQDLFGGTSADAEDISQSDNRTFIFW